MQNLPAGESVMFSIDQNCHTLWDVVPKLHALSAAGHKTVHFLEDIDVAFAAPGATVDDPALKLAKERFHRSGGADWGAALFYSAFLGRLPVEVRDFEPMTGLKTNALARQLGRSVDDLYDEFSPGDNWQLIGSSYVGDRRHHRVIGDLTVAETAPFLREIFAKARADLFGAFPRRDCRERLGEWFAVEEGRLDRLLAEHRDGGLIGLYRQWMREVLPPGVALELTSDLFARGADAGRTALMDLFVRQYDRAAGLYNEAVQEASVGLRPLRRSEGELPFFATCRHAGRLVRTALHLADGAVHVADRAVPLDDDGGLPVGGLEAAGVLALAGKAALLVLQARLAPGGASLAVPYRGSLYMPAAHRLETKLAAAGLLPGHVHPLTRVRFHLLDRMAGLDVPIRLPAHLAAAFGREEIAAADLAAGYANLAREASDRLASFRDPASREAWQNRTLGDTFREISLLDVRRREIARRDPKDPEGRTIWKRIKALQADVLDATVRQIDRDMQLRDIDVWDSRGALWPSCIALGGETFYNYVVRNAEIYQEPPG